jgi:chromosome segregation ATPase
MARFRAEDGTEIFVDTKKRTVVKDGRTFKRVPREKPKSRATRLSEVTSDLHTRLDELENIKAEFDDSSEKKMAELEELCSRFEDIVGSIELGEIEALYDEMSAWRDNFPENLQSTSKYEEVETAADALETQKDEIESLSFSHNPKDSTIEDIEGAMQEVIDTLENAISELESVEFPSMF